MSIATLVGNTYEGVEENFPWNANCVVTFFFCLGSALSSNEMICVLTYTVLIDDVHNYTYTTLKASFIKQ